LYPELGTKIAQLGMIMLGVLWAAHTEIRGRQAEQPGLTTVR
jgi:hypothetical protein